MFKIQSTTLFAAACLLVAPLGCSAADETGAEDSAAPETVSSQTLSLRAPPLPSPELAVPEGNRLAFYNDAVGVQIYGCQASTSGYAWTFQAPEATLVDRRGRAVISHYAGPTWESVADGSKVTASKVAEFTDDPSAIPELLLKATPQSNAGRMSRVTYIQRLETSGGRAPSSGCDAAHVGALARVDYTATYYFYEAKPGRCH